MRSEYDNESAMPEAEVPAESSDEPLPESPEAETPETDIPPEITGPSETFEPNLPEPADVTPFGRTIIQPRPRSSSSQHDTASIRGLAVSRKC